MQFTALARSLWIACLLLLFQAPQIDFDATSNSVRLTGAGTASPQRLSLSVDSPGVPPLAGQHKVEGNAIVFTPAYPLQPGVRYIATAEIGGGPPITKVIELPKPDMTPTTTVSNVYPSADVVPENNLKFYIQFSAQMSRGEAYSRIHLLDASGKSVEMPFLELGEELWDVEGRRFTLFFDPGRIKTDLVPNQELGLALKQGQRYTLVIDGEWLDGEGKRLIREFRKPFSVGPADRSPVDIQGWRITAPSTNTTSPVSVDFPEPLDHEILRRELEVVDAMGNRIDGKIAIERNETRWQLTPGAPWKSGQYSIRVGTDVADLAGNMLDRPFEIDVFDRVEQRTRETRSIPFTIQP